MGVDHVVQSKIQSLRREFENLAMKKNEKVSDFSSRFTKIISKIKRFGRAIRGERRNGEAPPINAS